MNAVTVLSILLAVANIVLVVLLLRARSSTSSNVDVQLQGTEERIGRGLREEFARNRKEYGEQSRQLREEMASGVAAAGETIVKHVGVLTQTNEQKLGEVRQSMDQLIDRTTKRLDDVRGSVETKLGEIQADNAARLEQMRATVDEKLQTTLESRLGESFRQVSAQLEAVYKGLGEMQSLASGVGDLKKVLSNVKTRGTWAEEQIGDLLEQTLAPDQYERNVAVRPNSAERVEFAIRLPGNDGGRPMWLPIDAKFPREDYERLVEASERGDGDAVALYAKVLEDRVCAEAKKIRERYIDPPYTTDFAILFLPTEGLYAEVLRRPGVQDRLRHERVVLAGPTTLDAILNSLRMGFRTLAIQKRSSEVWSVLGNVKSQFGKFGQVLDKVHKKLQEASNTVEEAQQRSRAVERQLRGVEESPESQKVLPGMEGLVEDENGAKGR